MSHSEFIALAVSEAKKNKLKGGLAEGAVLVKGNAVISSSGNLSAEQNNPIATAEMSCIQSAGRRSDQAELILYSTRYPDMLTAGTIVQFSIGGLVVGQPETASEVIDFLSAKGVPVSFCP